MHEKMHILFLVLKWRQKQLEISKNRNGKQGDNHECKQKSDNKKEKHNFLFGLHHFQRDKKL